MAERVGSPAENDGGGDHLRGMNDDGHMAESKGFTAEEKAAMRERAKELKAEARASKDRAAGERDVLEKIAEMPPPDRKLAKRLHEIVAIKELTAKEEAKSGKLVKKAVS
jgi:hypothetical protein